MNIELRHSSWLSTADLHRIGHILGRLQHLEVGRRQQIAVADLLLPASATGDCVWTPLTVAQPSQYWMHSLDRRGYSNGPCRAAYLAGQSAENAQKTCWRQVTTTGVVYEPVALIIVSCHTRFCQHTEKFSTVYRVL
jgi:hypothetical protein